MPAIRRITQKVIDQIHAVPNHAAIRALRPYEDLAFGAVRLNQPTPCIGLITPAKIIQAGGFTDATITLTRATLFGEAPNVPGIGIDRIWVSQFSPRMPPALAIYFASSPTPLVVMPKQGTLGGPFAWEFHAPDVSIGANKEGCLINARAKPIQHVPGGFTIKGGHAFFGHLKFAGR